MLLNRNRFNLFFMICGCVGGKNLDPAQRLTEVSKAQTEFKVTMVALVVIAFFAAYAGLILCGLNVMPQTMSLGLGVIPFTIGMHALILAVFLLSGSLGFGVATGVATLRRHQLSQIP